LRIVGDGICECSFVWLVVGSGLFSFH
jgi:hypothetical protein